MAAFRSSIAGNKEPEKSSGEEYETDLLKVDIKPEIYAQTVTTSNRRGPRTLIVQPLGTGCDQGPKQINHGAVRHYLHMQHTTR